MTPERLLELLRAVQNGEMNPETALETLRHLPFEDLGFARVDHHRSLRQGFPEVVFCEGKTTEQVVAITERLIAHGAPVLATRVDPRVAEALLEAHPEAQHNPTARTVVIDPRPDGERSPASGGLVLVITAGTSDMPVAEEACVTVEIMGARADRLHDVGVSGIHRLLAHTDRLAAADVLIVVAGMEGALPSVVGGLVSAPVIAVPTSVGYGANLGGLTALLAMLNSCAMGVVVVNIDNGFGAGCAAALIARRVAPRAVTPQEASASQR
jgi:NCAIR mutase (PurE)-related protein